MVRFTIRELLLLTLVGGLAVGWWADRSRLTSQNDRVVDNLYEWNSELVQERAVWETRCDVMTHRLRERGWSIEWDPRKLKPGEDFMRPPPTDD